MTTSEAPAEDAQPLSLSTAAARKLSGTTKTVPQMQATSPRWLLNMLPWVEVDAGTYRVNRRLTLALGDGRVEFTGTGPELRVVPQKLPEIPLLRGFEDDSALAALADGFERREYEAGQLLAEAGRSADEVVLIAHGKVNQVGTGEHGDRTVLDVLSGGEFFGAQALTDAGGSWQHSFRTTTTTTALVLGLRALRAITEQFPELREHARRVAESSRPATNKRGEAEIGVASGHSGEPTLNTTYVDYELAPREYELGVAQTVLQVHTRVADLFNQPMNQTEQQLRLTIEALRERQEHDIINNPDFGLLHNTDLRQRIHTRTGPPTPDDLDELVARRRKTRFLLAHPRAIAAFGRECTRRGIYPEQTEVDGRRVQAWRGIPLLPSDKVPISDRGTSSVLAMRTGEHDQGVVGLHQTGLADEYQPGVSVRFKGIDRNAIISYLVSTYYSAAALVPDSLGVLEDVEINR